MKIICGEPQNYSIVGLNKIVENNSLHSVQLTQSEFAVQIKKFDVAMVRLELKITAKMMDDKLKAIITPTTGLDHIDVDYANENGIKIFSLRGETKFLEGITSTAEHTLGLMLSVVRKIPQASNSVSRGEWTPSEFRGMQLKDKTIGIIGLGRLGKMMYDYCKVLGMNIKTFDTNNPKSKFDRLIEECDIISVHVPLNDSTLHLIGKKEFDMMKQGVYIINTSRGEVIDEAELIRNMTLGKVVGVGVDVVSDEHKSAMIRFSRINHNFIMTPHIAGACKEAIEQTDLFVISKFLRWCKGGEMEFSK